MSHHNTTWSTFQIFAWKYQKLFPEKSGSNSYHSTYFFEPSSVDNLCKIIISRKYHGSGLQVNVRYIYENQFRNEKGRSIEILQYFFFFWKLGKKLSRNILMVFFLKNNKARLYRTVTTILPIWALVLVSDMHRIPIHVWYVSNTSTGMSDYLIQPTDQYSRRYFMIRDDTCTCIYAT